MADNTFAELRSPRLILRRLGRDDLAALCAYRSLPEVARYQDWESFGPDEAARLIDTQAAVTDAENRSAASLFRRLGFRQEAHFVEHLWFKGRWGSEYVFALLRREWEQRRAV
jgi:RimJ/RimL family protein N-acetyltransferase